MIHLDFGGDPLTGALRDYPTGGTTIIGAPPDTDVAWYASDGAEEVCSGTIHTGAAPDDLPAVEVSDWPVPYTMMPLYGLLGDTTWMLIVDAEGRPVWWTQSDADTITTDFQTSADAFRYNQFARDLSDAGLIRTVDRDGQAVDEVHVPRMHHLFDQLDDGTMLAQQFDVRSWTDADGQTQDYVGDAIARIDGDDVSTVFSIWDWLEPSWNAYFDDVSLYPWGLDWTHGNAINFNDEFVRLSLGHAATIVDIDRSTWLPTAWYTGADVVEGRTFTYQHDPNWTAGDNLLMYATDAETNISGAVEYEVRDDGLHQVWESGFDYGQQSWYLGQARRRSDGSTLVNQGSVGRMDLVGADGEVLGEMLAPMGLAFGQVTLLEAAP